MKYFFDTEFIEGFHKPLFGKERHFIDLISIGIVAEDGREYYAISNEYDYEDCSPWVKENVILPIYNELNDVQKQCSTVKNFHKVPGIGKSLKEIVSEVKKFCGYKYTLCDIGCCGMDTLDTENFSSPIFYAYYADYDWVLFCSLFGTMMDLPHGFPMYCKDLKQMFDAKQDPYLNSPDPLWADMKTQDNYPKQVNEHNALADAKWNYELYKFITNT